MSKSLLASVILIANILNHPSENFSKIVCFLVTFIQMIAQLLDSDWPANILCRSHFWAQGKLVHGVCTTRVGQVRHKTNDNDVLCNGI